MELVGNFQTGFSSRIPRKAEMDGLNLATLAVSPLSRFSGSFKSRFRYSGMLGARLTCPLMTLHNASWFYYASRDLGQAAPGMEHLNVNFSPNVRGIAWTSIDTPKKWVVNSSAEVDVTMTDEDLNRWESCRQALDTFNFSVDEKDKILGKAFGQVHSPYWGEERKKEVPKIETLYEVLEYLRSLSLSDEDLYKLLKKFPEVLGCSLEDELKTNVQVLEKEWGIKGKSLRNLLLRNPKLLGYNVDCKGDCMAQCTRCWVRF
ncbi:Transcription termination factor like [Quillaja saponaria]|uniref:Transcription termination factor like n=1 Tax=Quillaja saponaria TaxID=32244 RepID=A0AAD7PVT2_QUISA|nr:Transcription termination factor like [Quillaja saponaria]